MSMEEAFKFGALIVEPTLSISVSSLRDCFVQWRMNLAAWSEDCERLFLAMHSTINVYVIPQGALRPNAESAGPILNLFDGENVSSVLKCMSIPETETGAAADAIGDDSFDINAIRVGRIGKDREEILVAVTENGHAFVWSTANLLSKPLTLKLDDSAWSIAIHGSDYFLAIGCNGHTITLFDLTSLFKDPFNWTLADQASIPTKVFKGHSHNIPSIDFSQGGKYLASASIDGTLRIWDINSLQCLCTYDKLSNDWGWSVRFLASSAIEYSPTAALDGAAPVTTICRTSTRTDTSEEEEILDDIEQVYSRNVSPGWQSDGRETWPRLVYDVYDMFRNRTIATESGETLHADSEREDMSSSNGDSDDEEHHSYDGDGLYGDCRDFSCQQSGQQVMQTNLSDDSGSIAQQDDDTSVGAADSGLDNSDDDDEDNGEPITSEDTIYGTAERDRTREKDASSDLFPCFDMGKDKELLAYSTSADLFIVSPTLTGHPFSPLTTAPETPLLHAENVIIGNSRSIQALQMNESIMWHFNRLCFTHWIPQLSTLILGNQCGFIAIVRITKHAVPKHVDAKCIDKDSPFQQATNNPLSKRYVLKKTVVILPEEEAYVAPLVGLSVRSIGPFGSGHERWQVLCVYFDGTVRVFELARTLSVENIDLLTI